MALTLDFPVSNTAFGDTVTLTIVFPNGSGSTDGDNEGVFVKSLGTIASEYKPDNPLLVPERLTIELFDRDNYLKNLLVPNPADNAFIRADIRINGSLDFVGYITDDGMFYDEGNKVFRAAFFTQIVAMNEVSLVEFADNTGVPLWADPFSWGQLAKHFENVILSDLFDTMGVSQVNLQHDWDFTDTLSTGGTDTKNLDECFLYPLILLFRDINLNVGEEIIKNPSNVITAGDFLRHLCTVFGSYAGIADGSTGFFHQLFSAAGSTQSLGTVLNAVWRYEFGKTRFVKVHAEIEGASYIDYSEGDPTSVSKEEINMGLMFDEQFASGADKALAFQDIGAQLVGRVNYSGISLTVVEQRQFGLFLARFWQNYKSKLSRMFTLEIDVTGLGYSYLQNFSYEGNEYQILGIRKNLDTGVSKLKGIKVS